MDVPLNSMGNLIEQYSPEDNQLLNNVLLVTCSCGCPYTLYDNVYLHDSLL